MLIKRRVDGSFAGIDLFYRNHAVGLSEDEVISKVKSKKCFVDSYEHYYEYIQSLDCFHTVSTTLLIAVNCHVRIVMHQKMQCSSTKRLINALLRSLQN
jgi:hypothetical protein